VDRGQGLIAELKRLLQSRDERFLAGGRVDSGTRRRLRAPDRAAQIVVAFGQMFDDHGEAHLRRRWPEGVFVGGHLLGGGHQVLADLLGVLPERVRDRRRLRGGDARKESYSKSSKNSAHGGFLC